MIPRWPNKDPDETLDYKIEWEDRLGDGDTIQVSTWIVPPGLVQNSNSLTTDTTTVWLSGGTVSETYTVTNRVTTAQGRIMDQSARLQISAK